MKLREKYPYFLANEAVYANEDLVVSDKYTNQPATRVALADAKAIDQGIEIPFTKALNTLLDGDIEAEECCRRMVLLG